MNYLHVSIFEESGECLISSTEAGLRKQVDQSLAKRSFAPLTDTEWADCVKGELTEDTSADCPPYGMIYYYKVESKLEKMADA